MTLPLAAVEETASLNARTPASTLRTYRLARRMSGMSVSEVREILKVTERPEIISFAGGMPAPELFPVEAIAEAHRRVFADEGPQAMQYSTTEGWRPLRQWIARRVGERGIQASADNVLITSGSQQAIDLIAKIFIDPGDEVIVENPCYLAALQSFSGFEARFVPIESDDDGMRTDQVEAALQRSQAKLIYIVSEFSNPKGTSLSAERREHLVELARRYEVPIFEDDPYSELRYMGTPPPPLAAYDLDGWVIRASTFSKTLSPGIRVGWVTAADEIIQQLVIAKQAADLHTSTVEQRAVARLLETFDYDGHIARLRAVYGERCLRMRRAIEAYFPAGTRWTRPEGGLFLWVELPEQVRAKEVFEDALAEGVAFVTGDAFFANEPRHNFIRLNFSNQQPEMIEEGIRRIAKVLQRRIS
ncbi:MAG TPA: PLP-dependent aminotransferase family protein [Blastocatellia bacterium]|nr:PLP-dependent aminotransferase family protein [Blastocatellia bacterium]